MKILTIGDIVSKQGCEYLRSTLPSLKRELGADIVIANGENSAVGNGILPQSAEFILDCGVDLITLGNHSLKRREIYDYLDSPAPIIRPANYHSSAPGRGMEIIDKGFCKIAVINLQGAVYLDPIENPFSYINDSVKTTSSEEPEASADVKNRLYQAGKYEKDRDDSYRSVEHLLLAQFDCRHSIIQKLKQLDGYTKDGFSKAIKQIRGSSHVNSDNPEAQYEALKKYARATLLWSLLLSFMRLNGTFSA